MFDPKALDKKAVLSGVARAKRDAELSSLAYKQAMTNLRLNSRISPYQLDIERLPRLNLANHRLLNHDPSAYFWASVPWPAPANADIPRFFEQIGLARFGPVTRSMRVFCDGTVFVKAASGLWFSVFGVRLNFQSLNNPLRIENQPRFEESPNRNPEMVDFLESLL